MRSHWLIVHVAWVCALVACPEPSGDEEASTSGASSLASTTAEQPTSGATEASSTTAALEATTTTTTSGAGEGSSSGGEAGPVEHCVEHRSEDACEYDPRCRWRSVFQFARGAQGCQGDVIELCVGAAEDVPSAWYRDDGGGHQVVQFDHTPDDLPPEWRPCDCDGPLACFCAAGAPDCPDRVGEFCAAALGELACSNSAIDGELRCAWFRVSPEGPRDDACTQQSSREVCLAAASPGADTCATFTPPYPQCSGASPPVYYREVNGVIELTTRCGPVPSAPEWTACAATDSPEQPDECGCLCL